MPYIITTKTPYEHSTSDGALHSGFTYSRRAVATLDEARSAIGGRIYGSVFPRIQSWTPEIEPYLSASRDLSESGGTVGPLPDGTVIEVETATWDELADDAGTPLYPAVVSHGEIIDAYNEAQEH